MALMLEVDLSKRGVRKENRNKGFAMATKRFDCMDVGVDVDVNDVLCNFRKEIRPRRKIAPSWMLLTVSGRMLR